MAINTQDLPASRRRPHFFWLVCNITDKLCLVRSAHDMPVNQQLTCIKSNGQFNKDQLYTLSGFSGPSVANFDGSTIEFTLSLNEQLIIASDATGNQPDAIFRAA